MFPRDTTATTTTRCKWKKCWVEMQKKCWNLMGLRCKLLEYAIYFMCYSSGRYLETILWNEHIWCTVRNIIGNDGAVIQHKRRWIGWLTNKVTQILNWASSKNNRYNSNTNIFEYRKCIHQIFFIILGFVRFMCVDAIKCLQHSKHTHTHASKHLSQCSVDDFIATSIDL